MRMGDFSLSVSRSQAEEIFAILNLDHVGADGITQDIRAFSSCHECINAFVNCKTTLLDDWEDGKQDWFLD